MARVIDDVAAAGIAVPGLDVRILELAAGAGAELSAGGETMAYVIDGRGETELGPLGPESVVWLDPGDRLDVAAGAGGLRLLVAHAR
jgi:hypothetical protein